MSIIQISDFKGEIVIANTAQGYVATNLQIFIDKYEAIYLKILLGAELYADFKAGLLVTPTVDPKWTALKNEITQIASFIYWYWQADQHTQTVGIGQAQAKAANADVVSPSYKMCRAWNEMVDNSYEVVNFISTHTSDYGTYYIENFYYLNYFNTHCNRPEIFHKVNTFGV